jgi:hypothetical protein
MWARALDASARTLRLSPDRVQFGLLHDGRTGSIRVAKPRAKTRRVDARRKASTRVDRGIHRLGLFAGVEHLRYTPHIRKGPASVERCFADGKFESWGRGYCRGRIMDAAGMIGTGLGGQRWKGKRRGRKKKGIFCITCQLCFILHIVILGSLN